MMKVQNWTSWENRIKEYADLEKIHKDHGVQLLALHRAQDGPGGCDPLLPKHLTVKAIAQEGPDFLFEGYGYHSKPHKCKAT